MTGTADATAVPLASTESVPLEQILRFMDHESDNFTAEILLKQLGAGFALQGTTAAGAEVVHRLLAEQQIPLAGVRIVDGSGLSRLDRLTAASVVGMLQSSWLDQDLREILIASLPVAGRSGTLDRRMRGTAAAGRVRAKTGTLSVASALSGYAKRTLRVLDHPERVARLALLGAACAGPLRSGPSCATSFCRAFSSRIGTPACWAFWSFEPGSSPTIRPAVFFETELETLAPFASSAFAASSRVNDSSVPVIT